MVKIFIVVCYRINDNLLMYRQIALFVDHDVVKVSRKTAETEIAFVVGVDRIYGCTAGAQSDQHRRFDFVSRSDSNPADDASAARLRGESALEGKRRAGNASIAQKQRPCLNWLAHD